MLSSLEKKINIIFKNKQLLKNIFIHRSFLNEHKNFNLPSNEKLEFLGDSVLSLITSIYLYKKYPYLCEGDYTDIKAAVVKGKNLSKVALQLDLGKYLFLSKGQDKEGGRNNNNILADCLEALIGGIFIDRGFDCAYNFVSKYLFDKKIDYIVENKLYLSPKSRLQEYVQAKNKNTPKYVVLEEKGPEHKRIFKIAVYINRKLIANAIGNSKKEAEENAAKIALEKFK